MNPAATKRLLEGLCTDPQLVPEYWNIYEPINIPFDLDKINHVVKALVPSLNQIQTGAFFVRKTKPRYLATIALRLGPVQWTTPHNHISVKLDSSWSGGEEILANYVARSVLPSFPDFAQVGDSTQEDQQRFKEFYRSYTPKEFVEMLSKREIVAPFGPYGCLGDVFWFNYFGRVYVDFIGEERLVAAGWARVEKIGEGIACYATEKIDDLDSRNQRTRILSSLEEFFWTPGCKRGGKRVPVFDFSEQLSALAPEVRAKLAEAIGLRIVFAGFTDEEKKRAIHLLEEEDLK
jgi:hypothetical protein